MDNKLSSLSTIPIGEEVTIDNIDLGEEMKKKLVVMGLYPGQRIKLLKNEHGRSLLIMVYNMRVILDRESGDHIWIKEKE